ncbi:SNF2 family N-terminal domain-containing protein [Aspergillus cavernicola]|uniref:SNF2 family N-terminal domain-containing protein n=1 Tax=Aspergillus cavernicola TaxID=176166 RepID=A0ABR4HHF8_9EURO
MALSADLAIVNVLEDLDLHHAILESLSERRPELVEQRRETMEIIKELETKLAELRGNNTDRLSSGSSSSHQSTPSSIIPGAHLDGPVFSRATTPSSPPQFGRSAFSSLPSRSRSPQPSRPPEIPNTRKRRYDNVDENQVGLGSSKRAAIPRSVPAVGEFASAASSDHISPSVTSNSEDDVDDLLDIFGLDGQDTLRALQEEQIRTEKWLEDRKEQERLDAEFARSLVDSYDVSRPSSAVTGSSPTSRPGYSLPGRTLPPASSMSSQAGQTTPLFADTRSAPWGNTVEARTGFRGPQFNLARSGPDSDDSDLAEITSGDFQLRTGLSPTYPSNARHSTPYYSPRGVPQAGTYQTLGSPFVPPPSHAAVPGPSTTGNYANNMWVHPAQAALATYQATRDHLNLKSAMGNPNEIGPSRGPLAQVVNGFIDLEYGQSLSHHDLENLYEYGADSKQLNEEIKQLLETIRPDIDISEKDREGTPEALKYTLMNHQKLGLAWMKSKEECDQKGGILADDMGLGKTIQAISLMVSRPSTDPNRKTTLIIAPVALMQQWKREIQKMLRPGKYQLSVYVLHAEKRVTTFRDLRNYDVVLTTFGTLSSELKRVEKYDELLKSGAEEPTLNREYLKAIPCLGPTSKWYRVIIDEAQCIKNRATKAALACCRLNTVYRWCMSGTPMMNNVGELHSLLKFLRIRPYANLETFNKDFTRPLKSGNQQSQQKAMTQLRVLLKAVLLRRTKGSKIDGKPILELPARISEKVHAAFSEDELELYKSLENKTQLQFNKYLQTGTVGRNYSNILVLLLRLRQACCHPHLINDFSVKLNETTEGVDFIANAKAFSDEVVVRLRNNDDLECPICIDAVDNPVIFFPCGHNACAECFSRISDPSLSLQQGIDGALEVKCPNCRGMVDPKKITDYASFLKVHSADSSADPTGLESATQEEDDDDTDESDNDSLSDFVANDSDQTPPRKSKGKGKGKGKLIDRPKKTLAELKKEASKNLASKRKYLRRLEKTWVTSAKIEKTMEIIREVQRGSDDEKTIIFSQFTSLLDLLEVPIAREGPRYRRYDGSMRPADRNAAVLEFTDDPSCKVMLVSLKAGNSGLNLVAANHVIIFDPFWNPYIEEQAIDRAHRIGQMREVHIHRILVPETVEDRIVELQDKKRELIDGALDEKASSSIARLSTRELAYLFGINN